MNLNDNPETLKQEEQNVLNVLISRMDQVILSLDKRMQEYIREARNKDISVNPDEYLAQVLAQNRIKDTSENRKKFLHARDELYHTRLLLLYKEAGKKVIEEIKIGLHSCIHGDEKFVLSWTMPLCRHYILNNSSVDYRSIVKGKYGREYRTDYTLLVKNQVKLRFTHVVSAMNMFPGIFDDESMEMVRGTGFLSDKYLDEIIRNYNPDEYDPESAAKIISDEFLQELLERRSTPEFKNIVFSIQKKQGEIIQAPYKRNMIVQGCAGSGKSMIMLHRLPILLYDNPDSLTRTSLYIITPSQMYIQLADNMRHQLEISDINMGTLEQYYDFCIEKYPGHKSGEYGKISYTSKISPDHEKYIYSNKCIADIEEYYEGLLQLTDISLDEAYEILKLKETSRTRGTTYAHRIGNRMSKMQDVLSANDDVLRRYFNIIVEMLDTLRTFSTSLKYRKDGLKREVLKERTKLNDGIIRANKELEKLDPELNSVAIEHRVELITESEKRIIELDEYDKEVEKDDEYFNSLLDFNRNIIAVLEPFKDLKNEFSGNSIKDIYDAIHKIKFLLGGCSLIAWEFSKIGDKYSEYLEPLSKNVERIEQIVNALQRQKEEYLDLEYYQKIEHFRNALTNINSNITKSAYEFIMAKIGIRRNESGTIRAVKCSPYIYLQILYIAHGAPVRGRESLLAIDEAQGVGVEELRLLKNVNSSGVVFNLFGDIHQHIEGTKGVENWDEYKEIIDFDIYEMQENYRNALQITEYCNRRFSMNMDAINTPGKGVHELLEEKAFRSEMITQLMDSQRAGLAAILVGSDAEARYLLGEFSSYEQKFHDMTDEDFSIHRTRWNIIHIDDAKGLEFNSVIAISGRMSPNQKYIAYTRALDNLYVYDQIIDIKGYEKKPRKKKNAEEEQEKRTIGTESEETNSTNTKSKSIHSAADKSKNHSESEVRDFFESRGLEVVDRRDDGGRLWVIGEKLAIRDIVNEAISKFGISGKYASNKESKNRPGWYTKTDK